MAVTADDLRRELLPALPSPGTAVELRSGHRSDSPVLRGVVVYTRSAGLLVRTLAGWRTYFTPIDFLTAQATILRPFRYRLAVDAVRSRLVSTAKDLADENETEFRVPWAGIYGLQQPLRLAENKMPG